MPPKGVLVKCSWRLLLLRFLSCSVICLLMCVILLFGGRGVLLL